MGKYLAKLEWLGTGIDTKGIWSWHCFRPSAAGQITRPDVFSSPRTPLIISTQVTIFMVLFALQEIFQAPTMTKHHSPKNSV
jgi:hypothetical protein